MVNRMPSHSWVCFFAMGMICTSIQGASTVQIARAYPDGGGYEWKGTGVPEEIRFKGEQILGKWKSTYCSGFTFAVVMKAADERGLLCDKTPAQVRVFQKQWYGATKESGETQCAFALKTLGIGEPVTAENARPGDFLPGRALAS